MVRVLQHFKHSNSGCIIPQIVQSLLLKMMSNEHVDKVVSRHFKTKREEQRLGKVLELLIHYVDV